MDLKKKLSEISCPEAQWLGLREVHRQSLTLRAVDAKPAMNTTLVDRGVMVEVLSGGNFAYVATTNFDSLQKCVDQALELTRRDENYQIHPMTADHRPTHVGRYQSADHFQPSSQSVSPKEVMDFLIQSCEQMKVSSKIQRTSSEVRLVEDRHRLVSTSGTDIEQNFLFSPLARELWPWIKARYRGAPVMVTKELCYRRDWSVFWKIRVLWMRCDRWAKRRWSF